MHNLLLVLSWTFKWEWPGIWEQVFPFNLMRKFSDGAFQFNSIQLASTKRPLVYLYWGIFVLKNLTCRKYISILKGLNICVTKCSPMTVMK